MSNKIDYFWSRCFLKVSGIVFITNLAIEPMITRRQGFEHTVIFLGCVFVVAIVYALALILINARRHG